MKKLLFLLCVVVAGSMFYSCEKDNLEGPDAIFAGELRDRKTGELIQQEISDGSRVYFIEQGWEIILLFRIWSLKKTERFITV